MDLIRAIQEGKIGGAALDVFEHEPLPSDSPLLQMDNVLLAPHNANSSLAAWERVHKNTIRNLLEGLGISPPEELDRIIAHELAVSRSVLTIAACRSGLSSAL